MNVKPVRMPGAFILANHTNSESEITLGLLRAIDSNAELTQRSLAAELGIALGLVNTYFKRCINKGYVKTRQIPRNRYAYYLTPTGFAEKSKLAAEYLHQSLSLFRQAHGDYRAILKQCDANGWRRVGLGGAGDLAEIFVLLCAEYGIEVAGIYDPAQAGAAFHAYTVTAEPREISTADALVVTSLDDPQRIYDALSAAFPAERVFAPKLLEIRQMRANRDGDQ
jgi:DNA-binding MarR family transcriptional regulator